MSLLFHCCSRPHFQSFPELFANEGGVREGVVLVPTPAPPAPVQDLEAGECVLITN